MDRKEYLKQLSKHLNRLPKKDYEDAMNHFEEYFDEVNSDEEEEKLIRELGDPRDVATDILSNLLTGEEINNEKAAEEKGKNNKSIYRYLTISILLILAAPIGLPLTIALIILVLSVVIVIASLIFSVFAVSLAGILVFLKFFIVGIIAIFVSPSGGIILVGLSLVVLCVLLLLIAFAIFLYKLLIKGIRKTVSIASKKRGDK